MSVSNQLRQLNGNNVIIPWQVDDNYPIEDVPNSEFIELPTLNVIDNAPFNLGRYLKNRIDQFIEQETQTNPIFGARRISSVANHYDQSNPFKQGNDDVANIIMSIVLTAATGVGIANAGKILMQQGVQALPQLLAALGGAAGGQKALDYASQKLTGRTWTEHMNNAGLNQYNQALFQPGAWGGSYAASRLVDGLINNGFNYIANEIGRSTITPEGSITIQPGEVVNVPIYSRPIGYNQSNQGQTLYTSSYTTPTGIRGSASGQSNRVQMPQFRRQGSFGIQRRVMSDMNGRTFVGQPEITTFINPQVPMFSTQGMMLPWFNYTELSLPELDSIPIPERNYRYEVLSNEHLPFLQWFEKQPRGTTQYYLGDDVHKAGYYPIILGGTDPNGIRQVADQQGLEIPDSASSVDYVGDRQINILKGGVPEEAVRGEQIIFKKGGRFNKCVKKGQQGLTTPLYSESDANYPHYDNTNKSSNPDYFKNLFTYLMTKEQKEYDEMHKSNDTFLNKFLVNLNKYYEKYLGFLPKTPSQIRRETEEESFLKEK